MAARKLFGSPSWPTNSILLQLLQRSPNGPNHDPFPGIRFPSTATRPSSANSRSDHRPSWATEYRRRLGIGDAEVEPRDPFAPWQPPKDGVIKINFSVRALNDKLVDITSVARNSSGDALGATSGATEHSGNKLAMQLYALKAAANLAKALKFTGVHDGPVLYETFAALVVRYFHGNPDLVPEDELHDWDFWRDLPGYGDLDEVGQWCTIYFGNTVRERLSFKRH